MRHTLSTLGCLAAAAITLAQYPGAEPIPESWRKGFRSIKESDARALVAHLAGPEFMGRGVDQAGHRAAAQWAADWLRQNGVAPGAPDGSYFQPFTMQEAHTTAASIASSDGLFSIGQGADFTVVTHENLAATYKLAFLRIPKGTTLGPEDAKALDGYLLLIHPDTREEMAQVTTLVDQANAAGAKFLQATGSTSSNALTAGRMTLAKGVPPQRTTGPSIRIRHEAVSKLAQFAGAESFNAPQADSPTLTLTNVSVRLSATVELRDLYTTMNVVGRIEGSDPRLKREAVVIGSHLDHEGTSERGTFWGADDNASGSTANLLTARALALNPVKPKRTVIIGLWSAEERGLWGSWVYANNPSIPRDRTVAYLNMDMVGRDSMDARWKDRAEDNTDAIYAASAKLYSPDLYEIIHRANRFVGLRLRDDKEDTTFRSDTASFARFNIPILKAFTGEHPDYHKMTDTPDKLNYPKLANIARWIYSIAIEVAQSDRKPRYLVGGRLLMGLAEFPEGTILSPDDIVEATLVETTAARDRVIDKTTITRPGVAPVSFGLRYDQEMINDGKQYSVRVRVIRGNETLFQTSAPYPVLAARPSGRLRFALSSTSR